MYKKSRVIRVCSGISCNLPNATVARHCIIEDNRLLEQQIFFKKLITFILHNPEAYINR